MPRHAAQVTVSCPCGTAMTMPEKKAERKKYCSNECKYRFRKRPSGLTYAIVAENSGWFQPGHVSFEGDRHPAWKGNDVSYQELHRWVRRNKTLTGTCSHCGRAKPTEWANLSREYQRDLDDWIELCKLCHRRYDSGEHWGKATAKYGAPALKGYGAQRSITV